uniref:Amidohydro-rel domain-containing protein n=1 Tax=Heterorhabditis bacteriophora TaxID=37862 RepID=A0A1I7XS58_HETBA
MEYFCDIPLINRQDIHSSVVSLDDELLSQNSSLSESDNRQKMKSPTTHQTSQELFGGSSAVGSSSIFERIPSIPDRSFNRKNVIGKELNQDTKWFAVMQSTARAPFFPEVEDRRMSYEKSNKRVSRKDNQSTQPGPEWLEGSEQIDVADINMECFSKDMVGKSVNGKGTPDSEDDWNEAKENVLMKFDSTSVVKDVVAGIPGPDLGDDEEDVEERTSIVPCRHNSCVKAEADNESSGHDIEDMVTETEQKSSSAAKGDMALVIRGAQIVNDDSIFTADVLVQDGVIRNVGISLDVPSGVEIIDACGKMLLPAGIDIYTQFSAPESVDDISTGCKAALAGGTATVVEVVSPKSEESLLSAFTRTRKSLDGALCNVALSVVVRQWSDVIRKEMEKVVFEGVNSFIVDVEGDDTLYQILEHCRSLGAHARILPENRTIIPFLENRILELGISGPEGFLQSRPEELESERVTSICLLSQLTNCPVSILSVKPSYIFVLIFIWYNTVKYYSQPLTVCSSGHKAVSSSARLLAKDFTSMVKGVTGVEERMCVIWEKAVRTGRIDPMRFVAVTSSNAAKMFNLYPKKVLGADADLVLWDVSTRRKLTVAEGQSAIDVSLYEGMTVHAQVVATLVSGRIAWKDGGLKDARGGYVPLTPNSPYLFSVVQQRDKIALAEKVERENMHSANGVDPKCSGGESHFERPVPGRKTHLESNIEFG